MFVVIDLMGDSEDDSAEKALIAETKRLEEERKQEEAEAYLSWIEQAPQLQIVPVQQES